LSFSIAIPPFLYQFYYLYAKKASSFAELTFSVPLNTGFFCIPGLLRYSLLKAQFEYPSRENKRVLYKITEFKENKRAQFKIACSIW